MYTRWRPVPSARTVRILYQLGYICSGTAFGLVTLCLEEQRRRIQILQRIADNAKIIRQHPRYRGSVALATAHGEEDVPEEVEALPTPENPVKRRIRSRLRSSEGNYGARESVALPPVADGEYTNLLDAGPTEVREGTDGATHRPAILYSGSYASRRTPLDNTPPVRRMPAFTRPAGADQGRTLEAPRPSFEVQEPESRRYRTLIRASRVSRNDLESTKVLRVQSSDPTVIPAGRSSDDSWSNSYLHPSIEESTGSFISADDVSHDVRLFLWEASNPTEHGDLSNTVVATKLFKSAMHLGSLDDIRALWLWKLENNSFTNSDAEFICNACSSLSARYEQGRLDEFFASVFASAGFASITRRMKLQIALTILGRCFDASISRGGFLVLRAVRQICQSTEEVLLADILKTRSTDLAKGREFESAVRLFIWIATRRMKNLSLHRQLALADKLFEDVTAGGAIQHCATLLRWRIRRTGYEAALPMMNSFVRICGEKGAISLLVSVFTWEFGIKKHLKGWKRLLQDLAPKNRAVLAAALSTWDGLSEEVYRGLSPLELSTVNDSVVKGLKYFWRSTRNFEAVDRRIRAFTTRLTAMNDQESLSELEEVAFEIYVSASKIDHAMRTITQMHKKSKTSNVAVCQTAFMFAKLGSWESFSKLLDVMRAWPDFHFSEDTMRTFNATLDLYCQHHSAEEILRLVTGVLRELAFTPNVTTSTIVLESFTVKQRFDLIPKWLELLSTADRSLELTAKMIPGLLRRFYIDQRPSHIFMMLLCRKLTVHSPSFASKELKELVEQSIAYDLRHLSGVNVPWRSSHAMKRLDRVKQTKLFIPSPGFAWNEFLYFPDSEADVQISELRAPIEADDVNEQDDVLEEYTFDDHLSVEFLRSDGSSEHAPARQYENEHGYSTRRLKRLEGRMWLHISTGEYDQAVTLYRETMDAAGIPASPIIFELAIEAVLRRDGADKSKALEMMSEAQEAGMNTTCATGPLLIHQLRHLDPNEKLDGVALHGSVNEYYLSNEQQGWRVSHYLGVYAAHTLMIHRQSSRGLQLLSSIYNSKWAQKQPLDIVALTVFLKGYITLQSVEGVQWVVQTVLDKNIRITKKFIKQLRFLTRGDYKWMDKHPPSLHPLFDSWVQSCEDRQEQQKAETHRLGWELVEQIASCSKDKSNVQDHLPLYVHNGSSVQSHPAKEAVEYNDFVDESYYSDESVEESIEPSKLEQLRKDIVEDWNAEQVFRRKMKEAALAQGLKDKTSPLLMQQEDEEGVFDVWKIGSAYDVIAPGTEDQSGDEELEDKVPEADSSLELENGDVEATNADDETAPFEPFNSPSIATFTNEEGVVDVSGIRSDSDAVYRRVKSTLMPMRKLSR